MQLLHDYINSTTISDRLNLQSNIESLEAQLVELRDRLTNNEQRHQNQLSMLGAAGSAIEQVMNFVELCTKGSEEGMVSTFWNVMMQVKSGDYKGHQIPMLVSNEDYEKMKISKVKKIASDLGITEKDINGSARSKKSWIQAIKEQAEQAIKDAGSVRENVKESDDNSRVLVVESKVVDVDSDTDIIAESDVDIIVESKVYPATNDFNSPIDSEVEEVWENELTEYDPDDDNWGGEPEKVSAQVESVVSVEDTLQAPSWRDAILEVEESEYTYGKKVIYSIAGEDYPGIYRGTMKNGMKVADNQAVVLLNDETEDSVVNLDNLRSD